MKHAIAACLGLFVLSACWVSSARADDDGGDNVIVERGESGPPVAPQKQPAYVPQSVALSGPRVIDDWSDSGHVPPGYHSVPRTRTRLIIAGACVLGTLYSFSALAAQDKENTVLAVPVIGPLLQLAGKHGDDAPALLVIDGLGQVAGAVMLIVGLSTSSTVLVRNDLAEVHIAPMMTKEGAGAGLIGSP